MKTKAASRRLIASIRTAFRLFESRKEELENDAFRKRAFETSHVPIVIIESDSHRIIDCNPAAISIYGFASREETLGKAPTDVSPSRQYDGTPSAEKAQYYIDKALDEGETVFEWRHKRPDGKLWDAEVHLMSFSSKGQRFLQYTLQDITERKKATEELKASEERFRHIFQYSPLGLTLISTESRFLKVNDALCRMLGYDPSELLNRTFQDVTPPEDRPVGTDQMRRLLSGEADTVRFIKRYLRKDGTIVWGQVSSTLVRDTRNAPVHFVSQIEDITERKRAEEQNELLSHSIEVNSDGAYWLDTDNRFVYVNEAACKALGYTREELLGSTLVDVNPRATPEAMKNVWQRLRADRFYASESVHRRKDGSEFPVEIMSTYVQFGGREYSCGFARDITERKRAEDTLRDNDRYLREAQHMANIGSWRWTVETDTVQWSDELFRITGRDPRLPPPSYADLSSSYSPESWKRLSAAVAKAIETGEPYELELEIVRPEARARYIIGRGEVDRDARGKIVGLHGTVQDISERKNAEQQLVASLHEKELLLKEIHHRVKNNLQIISSLLNLQATQVHDQELHEVFRESQHRIRAMALVHEKLYISRNLASIDFRDYLESVTRELDRAYGREGIKMILEAEPILLPVDTAVPCGLIVNELVSNALKHAFVGRSGGKITVTHRRLDAATLELGVRDDGIGFPDNPDVQERPSLGMTIISSLAEQISGTVSLTSTPGATFTVRYPG